MARPLGETSNPLFDVLVEWNVYLERRAHFTRELATQEYG
jgi:hypothetical protein